MEEQKEKRLERRFTPSDIDRMWELFFGSKWGLDHIGKEYGTSGSRIAEIIDAESARRWKEKHPHETNRSALLEE